LPPSLSVATDHPLPLAALFCLCANKSRVPPSDPDKDPGHRDTTVAPFASPSHRFEGFADPAGAEGVDPQAAWQVGGGRSDEPFEAALTSAPRPLPGIGSSNVPPVRVMEPLLGQGPQGDVGGAADDRIGSCLEQRVERGGILRSARIPVAL
jgi:hypothetical protein